MSAGNHRLSAHPSVRVVVGLLLIHAALLSAAAQGQEGGRTMLAGFGRYRNCPSDCPSNCPSDSPSDFATDYDTNQTEQPQDREPTQDLLTDFNQESAAMSSGTFVAANGYIDSAIPMSMFRMRYDRGMNMNRPDRAEFFMGTWREIGFHPHNTLGQPNAPGYQSTKKNVGLDAIPTKLDYDEVSAYLELAHCNWASMFVDIPFRMVHIRQRADEGNEADPGIPPGQEESHEALEEFGSNFGGLGDIILGFKVAAIADPNRYLTFQLRTFFPSGNTRQGTGTGHYSLEPALLYYQRFRERTALFGEFKGWIPIGGTTSFDGRRWDGDVLTYGLGVSYDVIQRPKLRVAPVAEIVGWTVLSGNETRAGANLFPAADGYNPLLPDDHGLAEVDGTTIVNAKIGVRTYFGATDSLYVGFGQALTPARWYNEIIRVDYVRSW